jgi:hypothetical protein
VPDGVPDEDATVATNVTAFVTKPGFTVLVRAMAGVACPTVN